MPALVEETKYAFFQGEIVPIEEAKISIMTRALHYGTACFEGIRAYWSDEEERLLVFRMAEHYARFCNSWKILMIDLPYAVDDLCGITVDLLRREGFEKDVYVRPLAYKSGLGPGVRLHNEPDELALFAVPFAMSVSSREGARATMSSWFRVDDNCMPPRAKIAGSYVNSALAKTDAELDGYDEAILMNSDGHVAEGAAENLFVVRRGQMITTPVSDNILEGITRSTLIEVARSALGIDVVERRIDRSELYVADEVFFCGTGVQVVPVIEIDHRVIGDAAPGPIYRRLSTAYAQVVRGKKPEYRHWCTPV